MMKEMMKCIYYNLGYCKKKENCEYFHPSDDCRENCNNFSCRKRHRKECRGGSECFYHSSGICEFKHNEVIVRVSRSEAMEENVKLKQIIDDFEEIKKREIDELNCRFNEYKELTNDEFKKMNNKFDKLHSEYIELKNKSERRKDVDGNPENSSDNSKKMDIDETNNADIDDSDADSDSDSEEDLEEEQIKCETCEYETTYYAYLLEHMKQDHNYLMNYKCDQCEYITTDKANMEKHTTDIHNNTCRLRFSCIKCDYIYTTDNDLKSHQKEAHEKQFACNKCNFKSTKKSLYTKHIAGQA